jgi:hypothetical protein
LFRLYEFIATQKSGRFGYAAVVVLDQHIVPL